MHRWYNNKEIKEHDLKFDIVITSSEKGNTNAVGKEQAVTKFHRYMQMFYLLT